MGAVSTVLNPFAAVGGIASGIMNSRSQAKTNETMMEIAQMNNEFNAAEAQKTRDFQLDMWNRNNEYNTPLARRERLEAAGYSPYADMSMNAVGGSVPSGASASASNTPALQAPDFSQIGQAVASAVDLSLKGKQTDADVKLKEASANQVNIDNDTRNAKNLAEIANLKDNTKSLQLKNFYQGVLNKYVESEQINARTREAEEIKNLEATRQQILTQTALQRKELNIFDQKAKLEMGMLSAQIYSQYASGQLSLNQAATELVKQANIRQDTRLKTAQTSLVGAQESEQRRDTAYKRMEFTEARAKDVLLGIHYDMINKRNNSSSNNSYQWFGRAFNFVGRVGDKLDRKFGTPTWDDLYN